MNKVILCGHVGQQPEIQNSKTGKPWARASLATKSWKKGEDGKYKSDWHDMTIHGDNAKRFCDWVDKGDKVVVEGSLEYWEGEKDGAKFKRAQIAVERFEVVNSKRVRGEDRPQAGTTKCDADEEVPF